MFRTSWNAEHSADPELFQPGEQVVSDFDGHIDGEFKILVNVVDEMMFLVCLRCKENSTVSEPTALLIQLLRPYTFNSYLVERFEIFACDDGTVQCGSYCGSAIGPRLVARMRSEDDKDAGRFGIALLRPPHCLSGRTSIDLHQPICTGSLMMAEMLKLEAWPDRSWSRYK